MKIPELIYELKKIKFDRLIEFGQMENKSMKFPWGLDIKIDCKSRKLHTNLSLIDQLTYEIFSDICQGSQTMCITILTEYRKSGVTLWSQLCLGSKAQDQSCIYTIQRIERNICFIQ